jgi:hypothetical protein
MMILSPAYGLLGYGPPMVSGRPVAHMIDVVDAIAAGATVTPYWPQVAAAAVAYGEVAIAYGAPTPGDRASLKIVGWVDAEHALTWPAAPGENINRDITLAHAVPAGATLYVVFALEAVDELQPPRICSGRLEDPCRAGYVMTATAPAWLPSEQLGNILEFEPRPDLMPLQLAVTIQ